MKQEINEILVTINLKNARRPLAAGAGLDALTGRFNFRPSRSQQGQSFLVTFIVYDEFGFSDTEIITIKVAPDKNRRWVDHRCIIRPRLWLSCFAAKTQRPHAPANGKDFS